MEEAKRETNEGRKNEGRAIPQAVSSRPPTAATRVRSQVESYGIFGR
jgi:hypothetical protein